MLNTGFVVVMLPVAVVYHITDWPGGTVAEAVKVGTGSAGQSVTV